MTQEELHFQKAISDILSSRFDLNLHMQASAEVSEIKEILSAAPEGIKWTSAMIAQTKREIRNLKDNIERKEESLKRIRAKVRSDVQKKMMLDRAREADEAISEIEKKIENGAVDREDLIKALLSVKLKKPSISEINDEVENSSEIIEAEELIHKMREDLIRHEFNLDNLVTLSNGLSNQFDAARTMKGILEIESRFQS